MCSKTLRKVDIKQDDDEKWYFITRDINLTISEYDDTTAHRHNYYQFLLFEKAQGTHIIDDSSYAVTDYSLHFVSPKQVHLMTLNRESKGKVCMFKEELFFINNESRSFLDQLLLFSDQNSTPVIQLNTEEYKTLVDIMESMKKEYVNQGKNYHEVLLMLTKIFLIKSERLLGSEKHQMYDRKRVLANKFSGLVEANYMKKLSLQFYADELSITTTYLNRICKDVFDKTASNFINDRIILEAKRILYHSAKSVKEISYELGFEESSYFIRFFKKNVGMTPKEFKVSAL